LTTYTRSLTAACHREKCEVFVQSCTLSSWLRSSGLRCDRA